MRHLLIAALCVPVLCAFKPALAQSAGETVDVGGWKVTRLHEGDGSFKQCNSAFRYDDGSILAFVANKDEKVFVVLVEPTFKLTAGQVYKTEFYVDKAAPTPVDAMAADATTLVVPIANDSAFMPAAINGNALFIEVGGKVSESPLDGSGKAIAQLGQCAVAGLSGK